MLYLKPAPKGRRWFTAKDGCEPAPAFWGGKRNQFSPVWRNARQSRYFTSKRVKQVDDAAASKHRQEPFIALRHASVHKRNPRLPRLSQSARFYSTFMVDRSANRSDVPIAIGELSVHRMRISGTLNAGTCSDDALTTPAGNSTESIASRSVLATASVSRGTCVASLTDSSTGM